MRVSIWTAIVFMVIMFVLGWTMGYFSFVHAPTKVVEYRLHLHCFNGQTWDRCRAGADGMLYDAHGKVSKATVQFPEPEEVK